LLGHFFPPLLSSDLGRAVFNLEPREVLERYRDNLDPVAA
jgi:hypothetical protein